MDNQLYDQMLNQIRVMKDNKGKSDNKYFKRIDFELLERVLDRLNSFSNNCSTCLNFIPQCNTQINHIYANSDQIDAKSITEYNLMLKAMINHLEKEHQMVREGHYMGMYMPLGMCFGVTFGIVFDNITMGISFGLLFGLVVGSLVDADAKKKGKVI